jgi:hypothetical protein
VTNNPRSLFIASAISFGVAVLSPPFFLFTDTQVFRSLGDTVGATEGFMLGVVFYLGILLGFAFLVSGIAVRKARSFWLWFALGLFFGPIALIVIAFMSPDSAGKVDQGLKKCPHCGEWIDRTAAQCRFCLSEVPTAG